MLKNVGFRAIIFSLNCYLAVLLSLYVAFRLDFRNPWWAMLTVYLTSQPLSGALRAKAVYRAFGTVVGGIAMMVIVPNLSDAPELMAAAIALWVGLCVYVSLLDRTPRSYAFTLSGYTAALIGFPSVLDPGAVFDVAIARMEEIVLGTMSAALVHSVIFPRSVLSALLTKQTAMLSDARRWIAEGLAREPTPALATEQRRIAADVTELAILGTNLRYDTSSRRPSRHVVRALDERLVALLPLLSTIEDRIAVLRRMGPLRPELETLIADVVAWCAQNEGGDRHEAHRLRRACAAALPEAGPQSDWIDLVTVSLIARLNELIESWQECQELAALTRDPSAPQDRRLRAIIKHRETKPLHRDHGIAALSALAAASAVSLVCAFWIATAWPQGAVAAGLAAVICSLFATLDDPTPTMSTLLIWIVISIPIVAVYQFAILPAIDGYLALAICLAPALIPIGIAMAIPKYALAGLAVGLGVSVQLALQPTFKADMAAFLNSATAVVIGGAVGIAVTQLMRAIGTETAARRLLRAGWRDLAALANQTFSPTRGDWASRMLDRVGLLLPRLRQAATELGAPPADALLDLRTGINLVELLQIAPSLSERGRAAMTRALQAIAARFQSLARGRGPDAGLGVLDDLDALIDDILDVAAPSHRHKGLAAAVGLRRNLCPEAPPYRPAPSREATA